MISDTLTGMADRLATYALHGRAIEPEHAACIATELMECARTVSIMEALPFDVTIALALLDALPEGRLARISTGGNDGHS